MSRRIVVEINLDTLEVEVESSGYRGTACSGDVAKALEGLGKVKRRTAKRADDAQQLVKGGADR